MRTVIFDLDGTLADTSGDLIAAANTALEALGHAPQLVHGQDDATAFRGGRVMLKLGFERLRLEAPAADIEAGYPLLLEAYGAAIDVHTQLYPGAIAAVERLRAADVAVGICTNKPEGLAETLMTRLGVRDLFDSLVGADTLPVRKPDPAPFVLAVERAAGSRTSALLVGDTDTDRKTARAAGVPSVLVTFGPDGRGVEALAPEALLDHYDDLDRIVDHLLS
ncbi:HAD-IA family hydrolase [Fontisubflavum oceani]|uniref:HAD-IA family hydrolase n=1 Tax=Fontisubflavum oceani TaxID=2978973 RepID=UPI0025B346E4|nr:HAD-IA family hydrolase [Fontisubflavum oceani]WJY21692.1 HAD-IA family hydrolase [Fontisubflavum oceani]